MPRQSLAHSQFENRTNLLLLQHSKPTLYLDSLEKDLRRFQEKPKLGPQALIYSLL
jgi:hypothetical protein